MVSSFPACINADLVSFFLRNGVLQLATAVIPVNITAPASCSVSVEPGNLTFSYVAFGPANFQFPVYKFQCQVHQRFAIHHGREPSSGRGVRFALCAGFG